MRWPQSIETKRLVLRPWREEDAEALYACTRDPAIGPKAGWPPHRSLAESCQVLHEVLMVPECYAITIKGQQDEPVGAIALMKDDPELAIGADEAELGYWIAQAYWNQGYMTEAVQAMERHAFLDCGLKVVWACHYTENSSSARVQQKAGLHHCSHKDASTDLLGKVHGLEVSRITREEWEQAMAADPTGADYRGAQQAEASKTIAAMPLISRVRSGGQTGADRGGLDAARAVGCPICGWCPPGGLAEDMPEAPGVRKLYPELQEGMAPGYVERTAWNVRDAHATLIVSPGGLEPLSGTEMTKIFAERFGRPALVVEGEDIDADADAAYAWLQGLGQRGLTLNVAGPRESKMPGTYQKTKEIVEALLRRQMSESTR